MSVIQSCHDAKDTLDLFKPCGLYLKPISRLNVSVQLPQLKKSGAKISNWEVMEKIKEMAKPISFPVFKVAKSSLEFIRFEAEIENYGSMDQVLAKLDMKTIKLSGFQELLKVRAAEAKPQFPTREEWDSFFRENKAMNEMKPGERPDTIFVQNLPTKWFLNAHDRSGVNRDKPSEHVVRKVFGTFGDIRVVDIPMLDPYRDKMKASISGIQTFTFGQDLVFEAYIQFKEYIGFVKAMNSLKGMKLLKRDKDEDRSWVANIKVDFDKTKHLAESTIKKRCQERDKLVQKEREKEDALRRKNELEELKRSEELRKLEEQEREQARKTASERSIKDQRRMEREQRRRLKKKQKLFANEEEEMAHMIAVEERKLVIAQRKLESIRVLDELLERVKAVKSKGSMKSIEADLLKTAAKEVKGSMKAIVGRTAANMLAFNYNDRDEKRLRDKLVSKLKQKEVDKMEHFGERLKNAKEGIYDDSMEDISDDDLEYDSEEAYGSGNTSELENKRKNEDLIVHDESDLKLTTSTEEEEEEEKEEVVKEKRKKKKKKHKKEKKKEKKKSKHRDRDEDEDDERKARKKKRELANQISLAEKIASREKRSRSREERGEKSPKRVKTAKEEEDDYPDEASRRAAERAAQRAAERAEKKRMERQAAKAREMAQEEIYDKMMNPHLYGGGGRGFRKINPDEHYEEVQKKELEREIWLKEQEEKEKARELERRELHRSRRHQDPYRDDRRQSRFPEDRRGGGVGYGRGGGSQGRYQRDFHDRR